MSSSSSSAASPVGLEMAPPVARIRMQRPPLNILDVRMLEEMSSALRAIEALSGISVVLVEASGSKAFSAGVEVEDHLPERVPAMLEHFHGLCRRLLGLDAVTVAAVGGPALGGGMELAACCDFIVASEKASFGQPEIELGCFPPLGASLYPALLGSKRAAGIVLLGTRLSARQAEAIGLVHKVAPPKGLNKAVEELLSQLTEKSPIVLRLAKKSLRLAASSAIAALPKIEQVYAAQLAGTADMKEGIAAFLEKRKPKWTGK